MQHLLLAFHLTIVLYYTGAAYTKAEYEVMSLVLSNNLPFLPTPMGKGLISDEHHLCVAAARST